MSQGVELLPLVFEIGNQTAECELYFFHVFSWQNNSKAIGEF